jgi:hypothetical protein
MKYATISQLLREMQTADLSESILKDIETIEQVHLRFAYHDALLRVPFEQWYEATFKTNQNENHRTFRRKHLGYGHSP